MITNNNQKSTYLDTSVKSQCSGCKVCAAVCNLKAISFSFDEEGFWYPEIDKSKCVGCNKCRDICPQGQIPLEKIKEENQTFAAYIKSEDVLKESVSGGMFTALSDVILQQDGFVFGCIYDEDCKAVIEMAKTSNERNEMRGAKYVQSDMKDVFKRIETCLTYGKPVLFSGLPCQVDAVKKYFENAKATNLYTVELICHGVPSPGIFEEYVQLQSKKANKKIKEVIFRDKTLGWTMAQRKFVYEDGAIATDLLNADAFNNLFQRTNCILRPSCYECRYAGKKRIADLSIADFWGIQKKHLEMYNNNRGCSLVLVNTDKGKELFSVCKNNIRYKQVSLIDAQECNSPLKYPSIKFWERESFFKNKRIKGLEWCLFFYMDRRFFSRVFRKIRYIAWKIKNKK